ncbi:DNA methyltransferase [Kangiella sp.]|uniref:DNA methyltransferase n=1 Tax=Kangiella sp. TaxID=1920245 RepID=UPI0019BFF83E|nr:DNA methyltransferase [Kangiella sp.]MBD3653873.1 hypothetical protein [Kangiella sp.]
MTKQLSILQDDYTLNTLPSAKVKKEDKVGVHSWTNFYASFSESFVNHAIKALGINHDQTLLDPFVGSGTTVVSGYKANVTTIGIDVDPFSCLLSKAKVSLNANHKEVHKLLRASKRTKSLKTFCSEAYNIFDNECLCYASTVFTRLSRAIGVKQSKVFHTLLNDTQGTFDSATVALVALCIGASESANLVRGSNPTWFRKAVEGEKDNFEALYKATIQASKKILEDLTQITPRNSHVKLINYDVKDNSLNIQEGIADFIITSPPYLTRIDYVVKHLPNLAILSGLIPINIDELRKKMIGTPKIVQKGDFEVLWGKKCLDILNKIRSHDSYASESYYIWTYYQYFSSLYETFNNIYRLMKRNAKGLIVLQDSFYKDLHIPLSCIAVEMLESIGFTANVLKKSEVKINMRQLNPSHQKQKLKKKASEDVVYFEK